MEYSTSFAQSAKDLFELLSDGSIDVEEKCAETQEILEPILQLDRMVEFMVFYDHYVRSHLKKGKKYELS